MTSQKLPLFGGMVQPVHTGPLVTPAVTPIFTPPDAGSRAPEIYELHLWVSLGLSIAKPDLQVVARDNATGRNSVIWAAQTSVTDSTPYLSYPIKVLDGFPVRGGISIELTAGVGGADLYPTGPQLWGYYRVAGQGTVREDQRRPIGANLPGFAAGLPIALATQPPPASMSPSTPQDAVVHVFEPGRVDEISLAFPSQNLPVAPATSGFTIWELTFERADNTSIIPNHIVYINSITAYGPVSGWGITPASPYFFDKVAFGGGGTPALHHIRVKCSDADGITGAGSVHGYFTRR